MMTSRALLLLLLLGGRLSLAEQAREDEPVVSRLVTRLNSANLPELHVDRAWRKAAVPHKLHFVVPDDAAKWHPIWAECHASWRRAFPGWEVRMWNDSSIEAMVRREYPSIYPTFIGYDKAIKRADVGRYLILHLEGGIYADSDYQAAANFEHLLEPGRVSIARSPHPKEVLQNALMFGPPAHPFWRYVMKEVLSSSWIEHTLHATGPRVVFLASMRAPPMMTTWLSADMFARHPTSVVRSVVGMSAQEVRLYEGSDVYAIHLGTCMWCTANLSRVPSEMLPAPGRGAMRR